jgi:hypothetical protein
MKNQLRQAIALGLWLLAFGLTATTGLIAQERVLTVKAPSVIEGSVMTITVSATPTMKIDRVDIFFRPFGSSQYLQTPANAQGSDYVARIAGQYILTPSFEFYVVATLTDKSQVTYPLQSPANSPESITILPKPENENLIILSPNRGEKLTAEDGLVSVSFYRIASKADRKTAKLLLDGQDVTSQAIVTTDLVTFVTPANLTPGLHKVSFDIKDANGKSFGPVDWTFSIVKPQEKSGGSGVSEAERESPDKIKYRTTDFVELRNEKISDVSTFYSRLGLQVDASYKWLDFGGSTYLTNEDKPEFQPRDRYQLYAKSPILDVKVGDVYPDYSYYLTNGLRVRGFEANLHTGPLHVDVASGQTVRAVSAPVDVITLSQTQVLTNPRGSGGTIDSLINAGYTMTDSSALGETYKKTLLGTYARNLFTARLGLSGAGGGFNLQVLRSTDDTLSVTNGTAPQQNVAAGMGFNFNPVPGRAEFFVEGAISMTNTDIRGGALSLALFDSLTGGKTGTDINSKLGFLGGFSGISKNLIIINQNLSPLNPLDFSSVAYHAGGNLNFFGNLFKFEYLHNGANYNSFGLSYFQADQMGLRISDRLRLLENKLFISLAYESLQDNLNHQKNIARIDSLPDGTVRSQTFDGTTTRTLFRGGISTFLGGNYPNFRIDYAVQSNSNRLPNSFIGRNVSGTADSTIYLTSSTIDNTTGTLTMDLSKGFAISGGANLQAGITALFSSRTDNRGANVLAYNLLFAQSLLTQDFTTRALTLNATLTFASPLILNASFSNQYSSLTSGFVAGAFVKTQPSYNTVDLSGTYGFLNNKLKATAKTSFTFGDFKRTLLGLYGDYQINDTMSLTAELTSIAVNTGTSTSNDLLAGVRYQIYFGN